MDCRTRLYESLKAISIDGNRVKSDPRPVALRPSNPQRQRFLNRVWMGVHNGLGGEGPDLLPLCPTMRKDQVKGYDDPKGW
jgi:hypothetical protein